MRSFRTELPGVDAWSRVCFSLMGSPGWGEVEGEALGGVCVCVCVCMSCSVVSATPWTVARQAPLSVGFSRQECCSGLPFPDSCLGNLMDRGAWWAITVQER